ncbi:MAG TPA: succinate--CoA ligase subunit alpha, partial [Dehalococcoidia bacterium]|nr:succinate--CoA ligase subunit alpha [Dehalococcoidia bacterium]
VLIVTERLPRRDVAQILEFARMKGTRVIGPNSMGLISPGKTKLGSVGGPPEDTNKSFVPGPVGIMSRSGGMTTEIASTLTAAGLGQSTAISIGGDPIIGNTYADFMPLFEADPETRAIVVYSEPGGTMEAQLASYLQEKKSRLPVVAFMAGRFMDAMPGMRFGHAGTIVEGKADTAAEKIRRMREVGIAVAEEVSQIPTLVRERLGMK